MCYSFMTVEPTNEIHFTVLLRTCQCISLDFVRLNCRQQFHSHASIKSLPMLYVDNIGHRPQYEFACIDNDVDDSEKSTFGRWQSYCHTPELVPSHSDSSDL